MDRAELQARIVDLMRQYKDDEIDGDTYLAAMMDLTTSARDQIEQTRARSLSLPCPLSDPR